VDRDQSVTDPNLSTADALAAPGAHPLYRATAENPVPVPVPVRSTAVATAGGALAVPIDLGFRRVLEGLVGVAAPTAVTAPVAGRTLWRSVGSEAPRASRPSWPSTPCPPEARFQRHPGRGNAA
jgi:hypothetical protein